MPVTQKFVADQLTTS